MGSESTFTLGASPKEADAVKDKLRRSICASSAALGVDRSPRLPALQFALGVGEELDAAAKEACLGLEQEYDAITVLATAHLLHAKGIIGREGADDSFKTCMACELKCKQALQSQIGVGGQPSSGGAAPRSAGSGGPKVSSPDGKPPEDAELMQQHTAQFLDALQKVRAMQDSSRAAKDKVLELGRSFQAECKRARDLEARLEATTAERDRLSREREGAHRAAAVAAGAERDETREALQRERCRAEQLQRQLEAQAQEHDETRQALLQERSRAEQLQKRLEAQAREHEEARRALRQERSRAEQLQRRLEAQAREHDELLAGDLLQSRPLRAERNEMRQALQHESCRAEELQKRLNMLAQERDEFIARDMLQSHALRSLRATEQQLAQAQAERGSLAASLQEERASRKRLEARADALAQAAAERDQLAAGLKQEQETRRHLRAQLEQFTSERDAELVEELLCRSSGDACEGLQPRPAA